MGNIALIEITISPVFSMYFGVLFLIVGCLIMWRVLSGSRSSEKKDGAIELKKVHLACFAGIIIFSGFLCFLLDRRMFVGLHYWMKVPLYMTMGLAISFALTFSTVDILNSLIGFCQATFAKPLVDSAQQVFLVLTVS